MTKLLERGFKMTTNVSIALSVVFAFMAAVTWTAGQTAIMFIAPIIIYSLAGCAILAAAVATAAIVVERGEWIFTRRAELRRDRTLAVNEASRDTLETERARMRLTAEGRLLAATVRQLENGLIHAGQLGEGVKFSSFPAAVVKHIEQAAVPLLEAAPQPLLPVLKEKERIMIYGPPDAGKTTLLRHVVDTKMELGRVLVIDPHGNTPKWGHTSHIGQGRDFRGIGIMLGQIVAEISKRYDAEINHPELIGRHPYVTVVIDELRAIINECKDAGKHLGTIICEGRKANVHICFVAHSKTVKGLGIQGEGDIRTGISQVTLYGNKDTERSATHHIIGFDEPVKVQLPGPYPDHIFNRQVKQAKPASDVTDVVTDEPASILGLDVLPESAADMIDQSVIACYLETGSYSEAFRRLYELENNEPYGGKIGGNQTAKVKAILTRNNIAHPAKS